MNVKEFKKLLLLNRDLSNEFHSLTDSEKATIRGGYLFVRLHQTDQQIAKCVSRDQKLKEIVENGNY
jgi:hypothetical protein